ncbi:MAG: hypothetical protein JWN17_2728 [Frankiales bacterium]|nr:hypothetical protein [Frankiales bacterium]
MTPHVRPRRPEDLPVLLALLQRTHEQEGYPVRAVAVSGWWLAAEDELGGWVATDDDRLLGHVALHPADDPSALPLWQQATGRPAEQLAVVSRLFTDRTVRGAGAALLGHAQEQARVLGRTAVLQVDPDAPARAFYGRRGWQEVGTARQQWGHRTVDAVLLVEPVP